MTVSSTFDRVNLPFGQRIQISSLSPVSSAVSCAVRSSSETFDWFEPNRRCREINQIYVRRFYISLVIVDGRPPRRNNGKIEWEWEWVSRGLICWKPEVFWRRLKDFVRRAALWNSDARIICEFYNLRGNFDNFFSLWAGHKRCSNCSCSNGYIKGIFGARRGTHSK